MRAEPKGEAGRGSRKAEEARTGKPLKSGKIRLAGSSEGNVRDSLCIVLRIPEKGNLNRILKTAQENET